MDQLDAVAWRKRFQACVGFAMVPAGRHFQVNAWTRVMNLDRFDLR
jgi:hypothetical protein